ncbi:MAG: SMI1/KNR4 family protein [Tenacibaculum sp.]|nr:SMI1/KNR4 family protein [Tenacibaculum sp.]
MIYSIIKIKSKLDDEFLPLEDEITGLRLIDKCTKIEDINNFENKLEISLPQSFKNLISKYDFGNFEICNIQFGYEDNYLTILEKLNSEADSFNKWWQGDKRPNNIIFIANSDPYTILLDCSNGYVYAMLSDDKWLEWRIVSTDFELFLRSIGTIFLNRDNDFSEEIVKIIQENNSKDNEFWEYFLM